MFIPQDNLLEDIKKCMADPVFNVIKNFSPEKSREYYNKWVGEWNKGIFFHNPAAKHETETFHFEDLKGMSCASSQAMVFLDNLKDIEFIKEAEWSIFGEEIIVSRYRLKTFDEWLDEGLTDALLSAYQTPEDGARMILEKELGKGVYTNTAIHMYIEGKIDKESLERLSQYEKYQHIERADLKDDIEQSKKAFKDIEDNNIVEEICNMLEKRETTVLKLKK